MKERPIIMSAPMVRAIEAGQKTMTRRKVKLPLKSEKHQGTRKLITRIHNEILSKLRYSRSAYLESHPHDRFMSPYGLPGDRLWVKETWGLEWQNDTVCEGAIVYRATDEDPESIKWKSPLFMPRWASRFTLEIVSVKAERLNDISEEDAAAEGFVYYDGWHSFHTKEVFSTAREAYLDLWESIHGMETWDLNPWVWAIKFKKVDSNG